MARINVEDSIYKDIRFIDLIGKLGGLDTALGSMVRAWSLAQKYYLVNGGKIPKPVWKSQRLRDEIISCGLANDDGDFIYINGSKDQFSWLKARSESGKKSGRSRRDASIKTIKKKHEQTRTNTNKHEPLTLSLSLSPSLSLAQTQTQTQKQEDEILAEPAGSAGVSGGASQIALVWRAYSEAYLDRHGTSPVGNAKTFGMLKNYCKRLPSDECCAVARFYTTHNDRFYTAQMHPVSLLLRDAEKLRTEWVTGNQMLSSKAQEQERMRHNTDSWEKAADRIIKIKNQQDESSKKNETE